METQGEKEKSQGWLQGALAPAFFPRAAKPLAGEDVSERLRERDRWGLRN